MLNDLRYGLRMLMRRPIVSLIAILSLALGIGANTAIFSLTDAVMLKSLPVREPDKLVLFGKGESAGVTNGFPDGSTDLYSYPFFRRVKENKNSFEGVGALLSIPWGLHGSVNGADIEKIDVQLVSGTYFPVLGVNALLGRTLNDADDQVTGNHPVAVVSYAWWESRLGGRSDAVGQTINIDNVLYTIVGVAPRDFFGTTVGQAPNVWIPLAMGKKLPPAYWDGREDDGFQSLYLIGRLKDGVTAEQASADVNLTFKQFLKDAANNPPNERQLRGLQSAFIELTSVGRGLSELRTQFSLSLKILMAVVGLVLLIACANVANILLAHGATRRKEFAVRLAVGARPTRLARQLFTESLLIAGLGGIAGIVLAWWGSRMLLLMASDGPDALPLDVAPNLRILAFSFGVSVLSAITFGIAPALRATQVEPNSTLKAGRTGAPTTFQSRFGKLLVVAQVALSLVLLIGAGLFVRTLMNLQHIPTGFNQDNVVRFAVDTTTPGFKPEDPKYAAMLADVEDSVRRVPGVDSAAFSFFVFNQGGWNSLAQTSETNLSEKERRVNNNVVGRDFFAVMGIPLVQGRLFSEIDTATSQKVAVITETMAKRVFPNKSPIGQRFGISGPESANTWEVVGVVKDAKYGSLKEEVRSMAYYLSAQAPQPLSNFMVRIKGNPDQVVPNIRQAIKQVNRNLPIDDVVTLSDHIGRSLVQPKLIARLASFFGLLAVSLACIGLYGLMSYGVARRTNEIGIRMALGAHTSKVLWLVLREALTLVAIGVAVGLVAALLTTKTAETLLFGLKPNDPLTIAMAALLLFVVAIVAGYLPARRAARVDPMTALREE